VSNRKIRNYGNKTTSRVLNRYTRNAIVKKTENLALVTKKIQSTKRDGLKKAVP
jgi:hypothetical protein